MRDCLAKSLFSKDYARYSCETASHHIVALQSLRHEARHSKFYGDIGSSCSFFFFFISSGKRRQRSRPETLQRCGRLISWLNIIGRRKGERSLSLSLILIGPLVLLYDPPQLATARSSAAAWCPANDRNPIFHCHRPSTFSRNEISGLAKATFSSLKSNFVWILCDIALTSDIRRI